MQRGTWQHVGTMIVFVALTFVIGNVARLVAAFSMEDVFYINGILVLTITLCVLIVIGLAQWLKRQWFLRLCAAIALALAFVAAGYEIVKIYDGRFDTLRGEVDLRVYSPFAEDTLAASLEGEADFRVNDPLPLLDGATALYPLYAALAQAVYPEKAYNPWNSEVRSTTTPYAYGSLIKGEADIIFAAGPSDEQFKAAQAAGVTLKLTPIGKEAFVFFVNGDNPVKGLTTEEIKGIYSGEIGNWSDLGGKRQEIRAFQRPEGSGSQTALQRLMDGRKLMTPPTRNVAGGMGDIIKQTADYRNYPGAIGYSFLFYATEMADSGDILLLEVDGVMPRRETIQDDSYPFASTFYAVTAGSDNPHVEGFLQWILSEQGQKLVEKTGYTPIAMP